MVMARIHISDEQRGDIPSEISDLTVWLFGEMKGHYPGFCKGLRLSETVKTMSIWQHHLMIFPEDSVVTAMEKCADKFVGKTAPNISEFKQTCKRRAAVGPSYQNLSPGVLKSSQEKGTRAVQVMREVLRKSDIAAQARQRKREAERKHEQLKKRLDQDEQLRLAGKLYGKHRE